MDPLVLRKIRDVVGGHWATPQAAVEVRAICTDSRDMKAHSLFVPIKGENFDGHKFLADAAKGGAVAALIEQQPVQQKTSLPLLKVVDTRKALGALARHVRRKFHGKVIGVAGSNGKTSTKHFIHASLSAGLRGSSSPKSFNNDIGVPLAIFPADSRQDYLVLEMGTNHPGEIRTLTRMAEPDAVVLTNASAEHLEFLGDVPGVRRENASIIERLNPTGLLVVNGDDPELIEAVASYSGNWVSFGFAPVNNLFAADVRPDASGVRFKLNGQQEVFVPLLGRHSACNALAAIAVGRWMGLDDATIFRGLAQARGPEMRLQLDMLAGVTLLNDAYNANPASMKAALETLRTLPARGRRIAIVGDMRELGESAARLHEEVGQFAAACNLDGLVCVGPQAQLIAGVARTLGMAQDRITLFPDAASAADGVPERLGEGDVVLLKASRTMHLELVAEAIRTRRDAGPPIAATGS